MNTYEMKQEARRDRLERASVRAASESEAAFKSADRETMGIPFGQPILVGHHSEKRHRNALKKSDARMRKGSALYKESKDLARRAEAVGTGGISSDDPDAVAKLGDKRTDLERRRDAMKEVNAYFRAHKSLDGCTLSLASEGVRNMQVCHWYRQPFPTYCLTNIGARIRDAAKRVEHIEAVAALDASSETIGDATISVDPTDNRVSIAFPERLSRDDYKRIRSYGFVWSPTRTAFVRKLSGTALEYARMFARSLIAF